MVTVYLYFLYLCPGAKGQKTSAKIVFSIVSGAALASFNGIFQVVTGRDFIRGYQPILNIGLLRATASFKDANIPGIYLSALAPVIIGLTLYYYRGIKKSAAAFISLLALIGISYLFPAHLACLVSGLFFFALVRKNRWLIVLLIVFAVSAPFILPKSVKEWAKQVEYNPLRFMCNDDRIAVYLHSLNMIKAHPVIGVGGEYLYEKL